MDSTCKNGLETVFLPFIISISIYYSQKMQIKFSHRAPKKIGQYIPRGRLKISCGPEAQKNTPYIRDRRQQDKRLEVGIKVLS